MLSINYYVTNSTGKFNPFLETIVAAFEATKKIAAQELKANQIDVLFTQLNKNTSKEMGVFGYTPGPNIIYVNIDVNFAFSQADIESTLLHEIHHAMRWRRPGYGKSLGEAMITEGLATLFEEQICGNRPVYSKVKLNRDDVDEAKKHLHDADYNHDKWFFGTKKISKWFGYTYGYQLAKQYSNKSHKSAAELVHAKAKDFFS